VRKRAVGGDIFGISAPTRVSLSTISENTASSVGGGIVNLGDGSALTLQHRTVSRNTATDGGGIWSCGQLVSEDSAVTANTATTGDGGGLNNQGSAALCGNQASRNKCDRPGLARRWHLQQRRQVALTVTRVTENSSTLPPGGVFTDNNQVTVDDDSVIIENRPTNCTGSACTITDCCG
jgi:hypothetical protein